MSTYIFQTPPRIIFGNGAVAQVGRETARLGSRALIVTGKSSSTRTGSLEAVTASLNEAGVHPVLFAEVESDPSIQTVEAGAALARENQCDVIVGLGGGSPLDAAKGIVLLLTHPGDIRDYTSQPADGPGMPLISIPTTAGTASEITRFTVITDTEQKIKMSLQGTALIPSVALLDPQLTVTMPQHVTAATGMDALTHAIEAYISKLATPMSDLHALEAIRLIGANLIKAVDSPDNMAAREAMLRGQMHAGLAFSNASVALVHSMSRPLGALFGIAHGQANAMLLPVVMDFNRSAAADRYRHIAEALGENVQELSARDAAKTTVLSVEELFEETGLEQHLSAYGVQEKDIARLAKDAMESASTAFNPRKADLESVAAIYHSLL
ncbi:alcohol dehydrogenase [Paucidesulfovibrio gracilis DSM 16080]|uniref:Alcohol dehydrogenase n=1 Tax=Paucidesulfovibrio gracilis DSM 16080 TaxID=1121449 RepID=A0A1T4W997_9BACT|nr:iron-containing alcohol dehydrogenase [Paucidesulfovibrio gracilis]SKA73767.1 alcohol dehydrogenase [Paucidesulfovibrio gracilis DSM 16080]